ncbi:hypothetical protein [Nonomuraea endophytica]|uniref:Uncharacterized protein n=1 Tax=Nonomuraea endophytica TaxID=714136 RepID=A0A7W8A821_9ACTN|nr:hypothetical protein [Nonomuraea endophytica]MBB5081346.1 hypothetical protein [Nonomuraea endophytica]
MTSFTPSEILTGIGDALAAFDKLNRFTRYVPLVPAVWAYYFTIGELTGDAMPVDGLVKAGDDDDAAHVFTDAKGGKWIKRSARGLAKLGGDAAYLTAMPPAQFRAVIDKIRADAAEAESQRIRDELEAAKAELAALKSAKPAAKPAAK